MRPEVVSFTFDVPSADVPRRLGALGMLLFVTVTSAYEAAVAAEAVADVLRRGAVAAQVGTALLLADEAATNAAHRTALQNPQFVSTQVTPAFSGRYARALENDFTRLLDDVAPLGYPEIHHMTTPIRQAAVAADDPHGTNLWAGTAFAAARPGPAADIVGALGAV